MLLEELVRLSGYHRKYAITVLNGRRRRLPATDSGGKRLKAAFPLLVPALEAHGHLHLDAAIRWRAALCTH